MTHQFRDEAKKEKKRKPLTFGCRLNTSCTRRWCGFFAFKNAAACGSSLVSFDTSPAVGVPHSLNIKSSCSISVFPCSSGLPRSSSAKIHPTLQLSTAGPYFVSGKEKCQSRVGEHGFVTVTSTVSISIYHRVLVNVTRSKYVTSVKYFL
jgi:hypothetical protein